MKPGKKSILSLVGRKSPYQFFFLILLIIPLIAAVPYGITQLKFGLDNPEEVAPFLSVLPTTRPSGAASWTTEVAYPNVAFVDPVDMREIPNANRFVVAGKMGQLWTFDKDTAASTRYLMLDIQDSVMISGDGGLLGVVLHPNFNQPSMPNNQYLYIWYRFRPLPGVYDNAAFIRLSRYTVDLATMTTHDSTEYVMIQQYDRHEWHNGGGMFFGPDGFLYISVGDEGGSWDFYGNGQEINEGLFAGVLRIDVDQDSTRSHPIRRHTQNAIDENTGLPAIHPNNLDSDPTNDYPGSFSRGYYIPNDNPWQSPDSSTLEEFYAIGLRSPHRMTMDTVTGLIYTGDIGQGSREEVSVIRKKDNMQWPYREGFLIGSEPMPSPLIGTDRPPALHYDRGEGTAIIGGFVYRGSKWPELYGKYLFGDHGTRKIWYMDYDSITNTGTATYLTTVPRAGGIGTKSGISAFATDSEGEIYILKLKASNTDGGQVFRLKPATLTPEPPTLLSSTGIFSDMNPLTPANYMIPYELNEPFWSDDALKSRWMIIPHNNATGTDQISYSQNGDWDFPIGSVLVKHFEMQVDETNPSITRKLETRLMVKGTDNRFYGITYRWRDDQTDAELLLVARVDTVEIATASNGTREIHWLYPSRQQCMFCHNEGSIGPLGPKARQLNKDILYPSTGRTANQLYTLAHLGMLDIVPDTTDIGLAAISTMVNHQDNTATLQKRALSYLDANCGYCHRPDNPVRAVFDAQWSTELLQNGMIYNAGYNDLGVHDARMIIPGDLEGSVLYQRAKAVHSYAAMPPLAKNLEDTVGVQVLADWIMSLSPAHPGSDQILSGQRIDFDMPDMTTLGNGSITLSGTATSGLPIQYQVTGPATLSGSTLTPTGIGLVTVTASQAGNGSFAAAPERKRNIWVLPTGGGQGTGLYGKYYNNINFSGTYLSRNDSNIDFSWGSGSPDPSIEYNTFSILWEGGLEVPESGDYTFYVTADDGVRLKINGNTIIDEWNDQTVSTFSGTITLTGNQQIPLELSYYENGVYASVKLEWLTPSGVREVVPSFLMYPAMPPVAFPVEWLGFEAYQVQHQVQLQWKTTNEQKVSHYLIERSSDGEVYKEIGMMGARGQDGASQVYTHRDALPLPGETMYRIRQVDLDGNYSFSVVKTVFFEPNPIAIFPNPVRRGRPITLKFQYLEKQSDISIEIYDFNGRKVKTLLINPQEKDEVFLPTSNFTRGQYVLKLNDGIRSISYRVTVY